MLQAFLGVETDYSFDLITSYESEFLRPFGFVFGVPYAFRSSLFQLFKI